MSGLQIRNVTKRFGTVTALEGVNLDLEAGKMISFLGPSGCGKTTLLRLVAGLDEPTSGHIVLDGDDLTHVPAHKRNVGMVFQSFALFPHLSVGDNITYGMRIRGAKRAQCRERARELLELVHLPGVEDRRIGQLSGGQRQRVAIARALALKPRLFLLDEPMSALDANLREAMQIELRRLQQSLGITTIVVTHDQTEAMTMSDTIVVLGENRVQQVGDPISIYKNPVNRFVADFIGTSNMLPARLTAPDEVVVGDTTMKLREAPEGPAIGDEVVLLTRPEDVIVRPGSGTATANTLCGDVTFVRDIGSLIEILVDCQGHEVITVMTPKSAPEVSVGDPVDLEMSPPACMVLAK